MVKVTIEKGRIKDTVPYVYGLGETDNEYKGI